MSALARTRVEDEWTFCCELFPRLGQKQDAAPHRQQSLKSSWHMENIMVVSHSSCSTSSENYPISLTHYSHHFNSLQTAEHSAPILPPTAIITKELSLKKSSSNWNEWCYRGPKQRLSVLDAFPLCLFGRAELTGNKPWNNHIRQSHKAVSWCVVAAVVPLCLPPFSHTSVWERAKCVP